MNKNSTGWQNILKSLGPGFIFAGASIGVSHLVQATRAGALYGFALVIVVILTFIIKYPFFEFGPRYVAGMNENLLEGYKRLGNWAYYCYLLLSLATMFTVQAAVTLVTTGLFINLFNLTMPLVVVSAMILGGCVLLLGMGNYALLDKSMKAMIVVLGAATLAALFVAITHGARAPVTYHKGFVWDLGGVTFLLAFMGWMPAPVDISVWQSFWCMERRHQTGHTPTLKEALLDFNQGYWGTAVMALMFLGLGALVMYDSGTVFESSSIKFTGQILALYTKTLGVWSFPLIATAAALTMFSTTLSCLDAYARIIKEAVASTTSERARYRREVYIGWMIILSGGAVLIIGRFMNRMKLLVDIATIIAFLTAPLLAFINYKAVTAVYVPKAYQPSRALRMLSKAGMVLLTIFGIIYILWRLQ